MNSTDPKVNEVINTGIDQIKAGMRTSPDPFLWDNIVAAYEGSDQSYRIKGGDNHQTDRLRPVMKVLWSAIASAAAVFIGIIAANQFYSTSSVNEKDVYRQEISMQSSSQTSAENMMYEFYNEE